VRRTLPLLVALAGCATAAGDGDDRPRVDATPIDVPDAGVAGDAPALYRFDRTQSPITPFVTASIRAIVDQGTRGGDRFAKLGDSITVSDQFFHCFAPSSPDTLPAPLEPTRDAFAGGMISGTTPFDRVSAGAGIGWNLGTLLAGAPSPLDQELDAATARYAVVMFGSNDVDTPQAFDVFGERLFQVVDRLIGEGTIPILSTVPPRDLDANDAYVPIYNAIVRGVAQSRQIPLVDYYREMAALDGQGLGPDGLPPDSLGGGCDFSPEGLLHGYPVRNLVTIEALDRARQIVEGEVEAWESTAPVMSGLGTAGAPLGPGAIQFVDARDSTEGPSRGLDGYACDPTKDESGPEWVYRLQVTSATTIHAVVVDRGTADIDLHLLEGEATAAACIARDHDELIQAVDPGVYYLVLDTFVSGGTEHGGDFLVAVTTE
jgi:hypothetical protein